MLAEGLSPSEISRRIFNEDDFYIKMATVMRKRRLALVGTPEASKPEPSHAKLKDL